MLIPLLEHEKRPDQPGIVAAGEGAGIPRGKIALNQRRDKIRIEKILPFLEKHAEHSLVVIEDSTVMVTDYIRKREAERRAKFGE